MERKENISIQFGDKITAFFYKKNIERFDPINFLWTYSVTEEEIEELENGKVPDRIDQLLDSTTIIDEFKDEKILENIELSERFAKCKMAKIMILRSATNRYRSECLTRVNTGCPKTILESLPFKENDPQYKKVKTFLAVHGAFDIFLSAMSSKADGGLTIDYHVATALKRIFDRIGIKAFWWADNEISTKMQQWQIGTKIALGLGMSQNYVGFAFEGGEGSYDPWLRKKTNLQNETNYFYYELDTFCRLKSADVSVEAFFEKLLHFNKNHQRMGIPTAGERIVEFFSERKLTPTDVMNTPLDGNSSLEKYQEYSTADVVDIPLNTIRGLVEESVVDYPKNCDVYEVKKHVEYVLIRLYQQLDCVQKAIDRNDPKNRIVLREKNVSNAAALISLLYVILSAFLNAKLPALGFLPTAVKVALPCLGFIPILIRAFAAKGFRIDPKATKITMKGTLALIIAVTLLVAYLALLTESTVFFLK